MPTASRTVASPVAFVQAPRAQPRVQCTHATDAFARVVVRGDHAGGPSSSARVNRAGGADRGCVDRRRQWVTLEERGTPPAGGAMLAVSRTLKGDRMVAFEFLRIVERDGGLVYVAQPNGRPPTDFVLTEITADSAAFENPSHDSPKMIRYAKRADGALEARVSDGGQRGETYIFRRTP